MSGKWLSWILGGLILGALAWLGVWSYNQQLQLARARIHERLTNIAQLKADEIHSWRQERLSDAELLQVNPLVSRTARQWLAGTATPRDQAELQGYLEALRQQNGYAEFRLIDDTGRALPIANGPQLAPLPPDVFATVQAAWRTQHAAISDVLSGSAPLDPQLYVVAPLFQGDAPAGAILLRIDARQTLYPLLQSWPGISTSGEALLVRREGDAVLFLTDLRHRNDGALNLRIPLTRHDLPAARIILGERDAIEGPDYRGMPVLAAGLPIPDTPWFLVAKVDREEILAPARFSALVPLEGVIILSLLLAGLGRHLLRQRQQQHRATVEQLTTERQRSLRQFENLFEHTLDGILFLSADLRILDANPAALGLLGYSKDELLERRFPDILTANEHNPRRAALAHLFAACPFHDEWWHVRKDGSTFLGEITAKDLDGVNYCVTLRDITAQKQVMNQEQIHTQVLALIAQETPLQALLETMIHLVEASSPELWCSILLLDEGGQHLTIGAAPSLPDFYNQRVEGLAIGPNVGSCGAAAFTGQRVIAENLQTHPNWVPFRDLTAQAGLGACWSEPIVAASGHVLGTFAIYHREPARPTPGEIQLIEHAASLAAIAIERTQAHQALEMSEQRYAMANRATSNIIWDWEPESGRLWWNDNFYTQLGYTQEAMPPSFAHWVQRLHPEDRERITREFEAAISSDGTDWSGAYRFLRESGDYAEIEDRCYIQRDAHGRALRLVGAMEDVTRRRMAERQAREAAERYERLLQASQDGFWLVEASTGRLLDVNTAACVLSGFTREELLNRSVEDLDAIENASMVAQRSQQMLRQGGGHFETWHRTRTGALLDIEVHVLADQAAQLFLCFLRDISARKRMEEALREATERLEAMLQALPDLMFRIDRSGTIHDYRSAASDLLYLSPDQFLGKSVAEVLPRAAATVIMAAIEAAATQGSHRGAVYSLPMPDGERWYEASIARMADTDGNNSQVIMLARDITQTRATEHQLRRLSLAVEQSVEAIAITDLEARLEYVNAAFLRNTGYTREEVLHQNPRLLQSGKTPKATYDALWAALTAGESWQGELINRRKDGSEYVEWASLSPLREASGAIAAYVAVKLDITDRKHTEAALREAKHTAEVANAAKSQFLAHMSHEIRTPMNAVLGLAQLLAQEPLTPGQAAMVRHINESGEALLHIISDILDLSKIEAGQLQLDCQPFHLAHLLEQIESMLGSTASQTGLTFIVTDSTAPLGVLRGDELRLEQVLINLIGNAIKFTAHGTVTLQVTRLVDRGEGVWLRFAVTDTGIGLTPEAQARLFQPFSQGDASITRRFGGTGLGLSISRRLVELMGGTLGASSQPGQGSTFWLELPLECIDAPIEAPTPHVTATADTPGPRLTGLRVLAVDDNRLNLLVLEKALQNQGAQVTVAADGQQALDILQAQPRDFDAVLMDVQMPVMDGLTATRAIREQLGLTDLPVIALTAGVLPEERHAALDAGMNDFLGKPIDLKQLVTVLSPCRPSLDPVSAVDDHVVIATARE